MTLYFLNQHKERKELVTNVRYWHDALELVREYLDNWDVKWYYINVADHDSYYVFDFGSHTEFFELR